MQKTRAIIPCAGFGTRMNMHPTESKEMLWVESEQARVIDYSLRLCEEYDLEPLIITRKEKTDLRLYLKTGYPKVKVQLISPTGGSLETVLKSKKHWHYNNILILPDTRFTDTRILGEMQVALILGNAAVIATHDVEDCSHWCKFHKEGYLIEKPSLTAPGQAMGLVGWRKHYGEDMFKALSIKNAPFKLESYVTIALESFKDITRTGKIE